MIARRRQGAEMIRCYFILPGMLLMLGLLLADLWRVQVVHSPAYRDQFDRQTERKLRLPGQRGRIFDRQQVCLADNRANYCVALHLQPLRRPGKNWDNTVTNVDRVISALAKQLSLKPAVTRQDIRYHIDKRLPLPFVVWQDVDQVALARIAELELSESWVEVYVEPMRSYRYGALAAHLLGYVGRADVQQDPENPYNYFLPDIAGRRGVEKCMDDALSGRAGHSQIRIDVRGFQHGELDRQEPESGQDVLLALDARIQKLAEDILRDKSGAAVVLDPQNGDVLALASSPGFDPNDFVPAIPSEEWSRLTADPATPLVNRALAGIYAPGSIMKPIVAIAALENHRATAETEFNCPGYYALGSHRLKCWNVNGHGTIRMRKALEQSCNTYFASLGVQCGYDGIYHMAEAIGFGRKSGIETDFESAGLLPSVEWKRRQMKDGWRDGDTANVSIGQGPIAITPLQAAMMVAAIANGGHVYRPRLVLGVRPSGEADFRLRPPDELRDLHWSAQTMAVVRGGMHDVSEAPGGTGGRARIPGLVMAGKTGTAEYGAKTGGRKHGWMIAFAPFDSPRVAVAIVLDDAFSGGLTIAPRMRQLMAGIFGMDEA